ncbi:SET domain-containing protein [Oryctes borbonicus]|uniref:SET domain-containing protein n=1 Tax=Oryctes borbonicus TaxID=1629725 RepID=A0A0T6B9S1_9SCAR|nr:SET domain-containing protein [Oryctes borbonicus]
MEEPMDVEIIDDDTPPNEPAKESDISKTADTTSNNEVVVLDDEISPECETIDLVHSEMTGNTKCINYACKGGDMMIEPPGFCLSFYRVKNKPNKKQQICTDCYDNAIEHYDKLAEALMTKGSLLDVELPFRNDVVEIEDSDSDEESTDDVHLDSETVQMLEEHFDSAMSAVMNKYDFDEQINKALNALNTRCDAVKDSFVEVKSMFKNIRSETDNMIFQLSDMLRPDNVELLPLDITNNKAQVVRNQPVRRTKAGSSVTPPASPRPLVFQKTPTRAVQSTSTTATMSTAKGSGPISKTQTPKTPVLPKSSILPKGPMQPKTPILSKTPVVPKPSALSRVVPPLTMMKATTASVVSNTITPDTDSNLIVLQEVKKDSGCFDAQSSFTGDPDAPPGNLPSRGQLIKPPLIVGETYYANRSEIIGAWIKVTLKEIIVPGTRRDGQIYTNTMYVVAIENRQKIIRQKIVTGREIAYSVPANVQLDVGARVIAVFREVLLPEEARERIKKDVFYPGIVAEPLQSSNKYRYLIFFDDGYAQYVNFSLVHPIYEASKEVWEDVNINSRGFIKKYLEKYPERPMVKLHKDQTIRTEYNGKWWITTVMSVDCSLVQMFFDASGRIEWIYRGSTRLNPMFKEEQAASNRLQHRQRMTRKANTTEPYVEYTRSDPQQPEQPPPQRSVARKSTSRPPSNNNNITYRVNHFLPIATPREAPATKIVYYTPRRQKPKTNVYTPHSCASKCKEYMYCSLSRLKGYSPLSKPLLCGFYRLMYKCKNKKCVLYKAPCGRTLRNMQEVHMYLRTTKSDLTVDLFDFNVYVRCLAEFMVEQKNILIKDLSQGKEECPITVVNYVNSAQLNFCNYSTKREPMEQVNLNTNTEFLTGCDCTDDCIDRQKCSCWQLTLQCLKYMDKDTDPESVGYQYRRLPEPIFSGIYECNRKCKCASTCLNRVVQNPLHHKLQIFQTDMKGWGIRCLNDIPQGSFICIYAGVLLTEDMANRDGKFYGDEYLAELDFIETAERTKEDYEEDPYHDEVERDSKSPHRSPEDSGPDDDEEDDHIGRTADDRDFIPSFQAKKHSEHDSGIRTRLRKRQEAVTIKQEKRAVIPSNMTDDDTVMISDDEDYGLGCWLG